jgi:hypothetical protein
LNLNLTVPSLRGIIKIHESEAPVRPVVNWQNAPAYTIAQLLTDTLEMHAPLPYTYMLSTLQLIEDLQGVPYEENIKMTSFDTNNVYTNIPTSEQIQIMRTMPTHTHTNSNITDETLNLVNLTVNQNYFTFKGQHFITEEGLAMGAPTSALFSEFYQQF